LHSGSRWHEGLAAYIADLFHAEALGQWYETMAFITGVDLEGRLAEESTLALPRKRPPRQRQPKLELEDGNWQAVALCDQVSKPLDFNQLLHDAAALADDTDPLEELRRRIKRTQAKMDSQKQVMDGFLQDVRDMQRQDRNFYSAEMQAATLDDKPALMSGSRSVGALGNGNELSQHHRREKEPSSGLALRPSSATKAVGRPSSAPRGSGTTRNLSLRSRCGGDSHKGLLGASRSQPSVGSFRHEKPLALPARRAPPGASCSDTEKALSRAAASRHNTAAVSAAYTKVGGCSGKPAPPARTPAYT
jgi:hypothetical protein